MASWKSLPALRFHIKQLLFHHTAVQSTSLANQPRGLTFSPLSLLKDIDIRWLACIIWFLSLLRLPFASSRARKKLLKIASRAITSRLSFFPFSSWFMMRALILLCSSPKQSKNIEIREKGGWCYSLLSVLPSMRKFALARTTARCVLW